MNLYMENFRSITWIKPQALNFDIYVSSDEKFNPRIPKKFKSNSVHTMIHFLSSEADHHLNKVLEALTDSNEYLTCCPAIVTKRLRDGLETS